MLHNTDPFGAPEAPLNMGAAVNMNVNGPQNIANGYSNLSKPTQEAQQSSSAHYNLPSYPSYGHSLMNPHSSMHPFQGYQSNVFQPSFMGHSAPPIHETTWQPGLMPMNLNAHADTSSQYYERKDFIQHTDQSPEFRNQSVFNKSVPLNVPHVYPKPYKETYKEASVIHSYPNYPGSSNRLNDMNPNMRGLKPETRDYDLDLSIKSPIMDESRRRSLENTVKMIENILIHNPTNSSRYQQSSYSKADTVPSVIQSTKELLPNKNVCNDKPTNNEEKHSKSKFDENKSNEKNTSKEQPKPNEKEIETDKQNNESSNPKSIYSCSTENSVESEINSDERNNNLTPENENNDSNLEAESVERVVIKIEPNSNVESDCEDIKPLITIPENPIESFANHHINSVEVKIEQLSSWADLEGGSPFLKDMLGMAEAGPDGTIIDLSISIAAAEEAKGQEQTTTKNYYECPHCHLYFSHPKRFLIHTKWHSFGLTNEKRNEEKMEALREREMKRNMRKEARQLMKMTSEEGKEVELKTDSFNCNSCDKVFNTRSSLKNHKLRYHKNRVRECKICHKTLSSYLAWRSHLKTHTSDSRFQCNECDKRFKYSHSLAKHKDTHLEKTMACEQCPKMFGSKTLLNIHMKTHERQERGLIFHCTYCGKGFFESYTLQVHERTHRNERPFQCEICSTSFGTNSSLQRHLKVSHNSAKPWECATCHRNFISEMIRDRHVLRSHGEQEYFKFQCTQCPRRYLTQKDLNKHTHKIHPRPGRKKRGRKNVDVDE